MLEETCVEIGELTERHEAERALRYARRNRIRYIDQLLNEFELLNLAEEGDIPTDLRGRVGQLVAEEQHPLRHRPADEVAITEWMDALYDLQDSLMLTVEDDIE